MNFVRSIFQVILAFTIFFGVLFGPFMWYFSVQMHQEYDAFVENGIKTTGTVYKKYARWQGKSSQYFVGIRYNTDGRHITLAGKVEVEPAMNSSLEIGQKVKVYYKRPINDVNAIVIEGEMDKGNIGPIYWKGVGKWLTIFAYALLFSFIFFRKQTMKVLGLKDRSKEIKRK